MLGIKRKKLALTLFLALAGAAYFGTFSQLEIISPLRNYAALVPAQIGALIYLLYLRRGDRSAKSGSLSAEQTEQTT